MSGSTHPAPEQAAAIIKIKKPKPNITTTQVQPVIEESPSRHPTSPVRQSTKQNRLEYLVETFNSDLIDESEQTELWEMVQNSKEFKTKMQDLESHVSDFSDDIESKLQLAQLYTMKLITLPDTPLKGIWAGKAEKQWNDILDIDPDNWDARKNTAFSLSQYPDFLNRQDESIYHYEQLVELQSSLKPEEKFEDTYIQLTKMYLKKGDRISAQQTTLEGLTLFPNNQHLQQQSYSLAE